MYSGSAYGGRVGGAIYSIIYFVLLVIGKSVAEKNIEMPPTCKKIRQMKGTNIFSSDSW
jgi:hypothetical protein